MPKSILITIALLSLSTNRLCAWGKQGHRIIAQIAKSQVSKPVADLIDTYLKGTSWEDAACWMDEMKQVVSSEYMRDWHHANVPRDKTYVRGKSPEIVSQLDYHLKILRNRAMFATDAIYEALKIIFHLVGDITQPLHCGYTEDRGGNTALVKFFGRTTNLHKIWDSELIEHTKTDIWTCSKLLMALDTKEKKELQTIDVKVWYNDSRYLLPLVYDYENDVLDEAYVEKNAWVLQKQLVKAGLRLAAVLEFHFNRK